MRATAVAFLALLGACYDPDVRAATDDGPELGDGARSVDARVTGSIDASACEMYTTPATCLSAQVFSCGSTCYVRCDTFELWNDAQADCLTWGAEGHLLTLETQTELDCVASEPARGDAWMGLRQVDGSSTVVSDWLWEGGNAPAFAAWMSGEPNDGGGTEDDEENCGFLTAAGEWEDRYCFLALSFVCET